MAGPKTGAQRGKTAAHLKRSATEKRFRNDDPEARKRYVEKLARRAARRRKKGRKG